MSANELSTDPVTAARRLLGAVLTVGPVSARIVETEAYGGPPDGPWADAAAHSYRGATPRNAVMFGPPGRLYTYRSHGIHVCANVSCGPDGSAAAVLLRAAMIETGYDAAAARRGAASADALARGPGNLCAALGITMEHNGADLFAVGSGVAVRLGEPCRHESGPRVGVSRAADRPWRFWVPGSAAVSAYRRSPRAPRAGGSD
ncbi:MAG: DNA-3-methyladenine glycosylase [Mycobacteriaceae bacterium]